MDVATPWLYLSTLPVSTNPARAHSRQANKYLFFEYLELLNHKQFGFTLENYFVRLSRSDLSILEYSIPMNAYRVAVKLLLNVKIFTSIL